MRIFAILILISTWMQVYGLYNDTNISYQSSDKVKGIVFHDKTRTGSFDPAQDHPIEGIAVSNGREIAVSDQNGYYELPVRDNSTIFVIKPRNWMVPVDENQMPQFYYIHSTTGASGTKFEGLSVTGPLPELVNFPLYPVDEPDSYDVLVFGDTQPRNIQEVYYIARDVIPEVAGTHAAFGITLGDNVFDNLDMYEPVIDGISNIGIPWIYVVGNHDLDFSGPNNTDARGPWYRTFGPSYYSFSYGPAHFIVLDNIRIIYEGGRSYYRTGLGQDQMEFLRNDISRLDSDKLIVLLAHIPWTGSTAWEDESEQLAFYEIISRYSRSFSLVGHTHRQYHHLIGQSHTYMHYDFEIDDENDFPGDQPHHMVSVGTVCGGWWAGAPDEYGIPHAMMSDGTPTSYTILHIDGNDWKMSWKAARRPAEFQMHIHAPVAVNSDESADMTVTAVIFNALPEAHVEMKIGTDGQWITMEKTHRNDPVRDDVVKREREMGDLPWRNLGTSRPSEQLWEAKPDYKLQPGAHTIHVRARDDWWEYEGRQVIYVW